MGSLHIELNGASKRSLSLGFSFLCLFIGDRANISLVRRSGDNVFLSTIQQLFYPRRQTPWESQGTSGEGKFVLRKLWISQDSVVFYCGFISPSLSTTSIFFGFVRVDHLYAKGASFVF